MLVCHTRRFTQVRARKLAEATAAVNELLLQASGLVNTALAAPGATAPQVTDLVSQVGLPPFLSF